MEVTLCLHSGNIPVPALADVDDDGPKPLSLHSSQSYLESLDAKDKLFIEEQIAEFNQQLEAFKDVMDTTPDSNIHSLRSFSQQAQPSTKPSSIQFESSSHLLSDLFLSCLSQQIQ